MPASHIPSDGSREHHLHQPAPTSSRNSGRGQAPAARVLAGLTEVSAWCLRGLLLLGTAVVIGWVLAQLWIVVLPALLALLLCTVLWPVTRVLRRRLPPSAAELGAVLGAWCWGRHWSPS